jgi:2-dehydropantoate 2-reductase
LRDSLSAEAALVRRNVRPRRSVAEPYPVISARALARFPTEHTTVRYIIYGAGAIGSIVGGHLHRIGASVILVGPEEHVRTVQKSGLILRTRENVFHLDPKAVARANKLTPFQSDDVVLLCAKTQQTLKCLAQLRAAGAPRTLPIFCCQNSFLNEPQTTLFFERVYGVAVFIDGIFVQPGEAIHPTGRRYGHLEIGRYPSGLDRLSQRVVRDLRKAGFSVRASPDVMRTKRAKFVINMANAVIAITNQPKLVAPIVKKLRAEAVRILNASGLDCESLAAFRRRADAACGPLKSPPGVESDGLIADSTWQSLYRQTGNIETPYFNGVIVHMGRSLGIPTPYNSFVCETALEMARNGDRPGKYSARDLSRMLKARIGS